MIILKQCGCGAEVRWCGDNNPDPEDNHECHHITCDNCGVQFSVEGDSISDCETMQEMREITAEAWNKR